MRTAISIIIISACAVVLFYWINSDKLGSIFKKILSGFFVYLTTITVCIVFSVAVTQLHLQSYYAASLRIVFDEILAAHTENEPGFEERLHTFIANQKLSYESKFNLLENARKFRDAGILLRSAGERPCEHGVAKNMRHATNGVTH